MIDRMGSTRLAGRIALVTGASRGIGWMIARTLAETGADVILAARSRDELEKNAVEIESMGRRVRAVPTDLTQQADIDALFEQATAFGDVDLLVNNAALIESGAMIDMEPDRWNAVVDAGLRGTYAVTRAFLPGMMKRGRGDIVMISSTSGKRSNHGATAYSATKFGLMGLSHALVYEARKKNVRVIVVSPSRVDTRRLPAESLTEGGKGALLRMEDVAEAVVFAVSLPGRALVREIELWGTNP